jgi:hypothetical protein
MWKLDMTDANFMQFYSRKMGMLRTPLPYGEIAGVVMDFSWLRVEPGGVVNLDVSGLGQGYEVGLQDAHDEPLGSRRPPVPTSDRVLRSARPTIEAATDLTVGEYLDEYGAFLWNGGAALGANKTTVRIAMQSGAGEHWREAILVRSDVADQRGYSGSYRWQLFKLIHSTPQLKLKEHQYGTIDKYKARLCACGNELYGQVLETYSPTDGGLVYCASARHYCWFGAMHRGCRPCISVSVLFSRRFAPLLGPPRQRERRVQLGAGK